MKRTPLLLAGTMALTLMLSGCSRPGSGETIAQVTYRPTTPQPIMDIYIPISEQFKESRHSQSLNRLIKATKKQGKQAKPGCLVCHSYESWIAPRNSKPGLSQVKNGINCGVCHTFDKSGTLVPFSDVVKLCSECHTNNTIKAGQLAGHAQVNMFEGTGAIDVKGEPDPRYIQGITCADCHMPNNSHTFRSLTLTKAAQENRRSSCILCHAKDDLAKFSKLTDDTQRNVEKRLQEYRKRLEVLESKKDLYLYKRAYTNITFVQMDGSKGMHNIKYTPVILDQIDKDLSELERL